MEKNDLDKFLAETLRKVKSYDNPQELEDIKKTIRKNVPVFMRTSVLAFLLKGKVSAGFHSAQQHHDNPGETSLYINIGSLSRTSAKDLVAFICEKCGLKAEEITSVSFKDKYSFVAVPSDKAAGIIKNLNGTTYAERNVKVNYSKSR